MKNGEFYAAVYGIIKDSSGKILFQRRANTGFNDGILQFPSGHIEGEETYNQALIREMKEEIGVDIDPKDIRLSHIMHRISSDRVYFDIFMEITNYSGVLKNMEPNKCSELVFTEINKDDVTDYCKFAIEQIEKGIQCSEINFKETN